MYASQVDGKELTFFVSGKLWGSSLVMEDKETGSEWSHILGKAMAGPLEGTKLTILPSVMTNWESWLKQHPNTTATLLEPTAKHFRTEMLRRQEAFGLGLVHRGKSRFWRFDRLQHQPVVNDRLEEPLVIYFDRQNLTPLAWRRTVENQTLTFRLHGNQSQDEQTQSTWDLTLGAATEGRLKGKQLKPLPAIVSFTRAWNRFHPESTEWQPDE